MSYSPETTRVLVAHESQDAAEQLINALRKAGQIGRADLALNEDSLLTALKSCNWEFFLTRPVFGDCDFTKAMEHINRLGKTPRIILLTDEFSPELLLSTLEAGGHAIVPRGSLELLQLLIEQQNDFTQLRRSLQQTEIALHESEKRLGVLMDQSRDAIAYVVDGMHLSANEVYLELFGYETEDDLAGVPIMDMVSSSDHDNLKKLLRSRSQDESKTHEIECKGRHKDGTEFKATFVFSPSTYDGEACTQIVIRREESGVDEETLRELKETDPITGLPNRSWFMNQMDKALAATLEQEKDHAVFYLRIDDFEHLQSQLGIDGADILLKKLAAALSTSAKGAPLARVSGEEFALVLSMGDPDDAANYAESLREFIEQLMPEVNARTIKTTVCVGVAFLRQDSRNSQTVLTKALECCNKARNSSKNGAGNAILVHNPIDDLKAGSPEAIALLLEQAIKNKSFNIQFQPIMNMDNDQDHFFEVYAKLPQEDGPDLEPSQFMPVAGSRGLASKVDCLVALDAMKQLAALPGKARLLINLSGASLEDQGLASWLIKAISATKLNSDQIIFQLNESDANAYLKQVALFASTINKEGCLFSISRFGGSPTSFTLFEHVAVQVIKFDGSYTSELSNNEQRDKFASMVAKARNEDKKVMVGFVESAEQMQHLWTLGNINYLQGFYLSPPVESLALAWQAATNEE